MSKYLFSPKSPFEEILVNLPFLIFPINLKFLRFSDNGAIIFVKSISISLFIWVKFFCSVFRLKNLGKLRASKLDPLIIIFLPYVIEKSLFFFPFLKVFTKIFLNDKNLFLSKSTPSTKIELLPSFNFILFTAIISFCLFKSKEILAIDFLGFL